MNRSQINQWTPGPWKLTLSRWPNGKLSGKPYIYAPNGLDGHRHICEPFLDDSTSKEVQAMQEANARLIVAAPELVDALQDCRDILCAYARDGDPDVPYAQDALNAIRKGYAALQAAGLSNAQVLATVPPFPEHALPRLQEAVTKLRDSTAQP